MITKMEINKILNFLERRYGPIKHQYNNPFQVLISCVLSQRTKEENTEKASKALFSIAKTPEKISKLPLKKLQKLVRPSGTFRQKAKNIKNISKILLEKHSGKVPKTREELLELPGVGFKTADVVLAYGHIIPAIPVDTHVFRISKRLALVDKNANVEEVRESLQKLFSKNKWFVINLGFVNFGREICLPRNPKCKICPLLDVCSFGKTNIKQQ